MSTPTYTKKQVAVYLLPWSIITVMVLVTLGAYLGWTTRSNFQNEVQNQVSISMKAVANAKK